MKTATILSALLLAACNFHSEGKSHNLAPARFDERGEPIQAVGAAKGEAPRATSDSPTLTIGNSPTLGPDNAPITIIEFSDLQCPYCEKGRRSIEGVVAKYGDQVRVVWKNRPLDDWKNTPLEEQMHPNAAPAAIALVAAGLQGNVVFWAAEETMFDNFSQYAGRGASLMKPEDFEPILAQVQGLDLKRWREDLKRPEVIARLDQDMELAEFVDASSTPTFFINGRKVEGAYPVEALSQIIDAEMVAVKELLAQGASPSSVYATRVEKNLITRDTRFKVAATGPTRGPEDAKVTIVAFSEFQCPACQSGDEVMRQIATRFPQDVRIVYRNFPLDFHKDAPLAAEAALAAAAQGKYLEYHDRLFAGQYAIDPETQQMIINPDTKRPVSGLTREYLEQYAREAGLDMAKFTAALDARTYKDVVTRDMQDGLLANVNATPTYFINGKPVRGVPPPEVLEMFVQDEIKSADALLASGVKKSELYQQMMKDAYVP